MSRDGDSVDTFQRLQSLHSSVIVPERLSLHSKASRAPRPSPQPRAFMSSPDVVLPGDISNLGVGFDPLADSAGADEGNAGEDAVHIRVQQRNGRKSLTTVQGLKEKYDYNKVLKALKKEFCCNGTVVEDSELGKVIQLQGDQRKNVSDFLLGQKLVKKDQIKIHGF